RIKGIKIHTQPLCNGSCILDVLLTEILSIPVLLCDKNKTVCAAVHAGWRGTVGGITKNAISMMVEAGVDKNDILAAIGPCIGCCCYEVGAEVRDEFIAASPEYSAFFAPKGEKFMLDLNLANESILISSGLKPENVSRLDLCTKCNEKHFFSHRRSGTNRGTMSAFICL
ncbi:MAG: laccase domain-containing protein, partial [Clostridia bacterium]|nr:laccase domain-containing protein [Clostridia bacterium]